MEFKLIIKKINNTLTKEEEIIFNNWFNESKIHQDYFLKVKNNYQKNIDSVNKDAAWMAVNKKIVSKKKNNKWKYAIAASVALIISASYYYFSSTYNISKKNTTVAQQKIKIGTDKATLTLEDGSFVALEKGKTYNSENIQSNGEKLVYYSSKKETQPKIVYNYLTVPRGGQFFVELSDNTKVWLNSESQLKYPVTFIPGEPRKVELIYGEAYFDVSPSTEHKGAKFNVLTQEQEIEVLGTAFNVKAYRDETSIYTTLVEGKVSLIVGDEKQFLKPGQQSTFNSESNTIKLATVDTYNETSWKEGVFSFNNMPLKKIMKVLSRWYRIDVTFINNEVEHVKFNGVLRKDQQLEDILSVINSTTEINYTINEKTIIIK
ncbi:FecR family protein [Aureibaculum marinum]|uniref:FecR family protein n=1 Tax=Aureibaculum marinum TaxID=2487930 RepID=A0A3N4NX35_9FLAO|nr:FecR family protein [Aureibaculum marinum]RPD96139.1 FecR family protein [Aureibaculum marinum]